MEAQSIFNANEMRVVLLLFCFRSCDASAVSSKALAHPSPHCPLCYTVAAYMHTLTTLTTRLVRPPCHFKYR